MRKIVIFLWLAVGIGGTCGLMSYGTGFIDALVTSFILSSMAFGYTLIRIICEAFRGEPKEKV